jgi:hypothetical protein
MLYCKEDNPELFEIYNGENGKLSLEERKKNYDINISGKKDIIIPEKEIDVLFTDSFSTKLYSYDELSILSGLFYYSSFLSHSCDPNTHMIGIGNVMFMFSERNIKQNEELTTFYVENDKEYFSRKNILFMNYGFICDCKLCQIEKENLEKYNEVKKKVSFYIKQLIDMSVYMFKYNINDYYLKHKEVNNVIEKNKDKLRNLKKAYYIIIYITYGLILKQIIII